MLLGSYQLILEAIHTRDTQAIAAVGVGAIVGLLSFSKVLKWLFAKYKAITLAGLTGFIIGSLNKIWPWKETLSWRENSHGEQVPVLQKSISPMQFEGDADLIFAIVFAIIGYALIVLLEKMQTNKIA